MSFYPVTTKNTFSGEFTPDGRAGVMTNLPKPRSAWLLLGDSASFFTDDELRRAQRRYPSGRPQSWTCSPRVEIGDVLFVYFMTPRKSINFICRAASRPYVDRDVVVMAEVDRDVSEYQWWVDLTPPIAVEPISFNTINTFMGGSLNLRGRSGKFIDHAPGSSHLHRTCREPIAPTATAIHGGDKNS